MNHIEHGRHVVARAIGVGLLLSMSLIHLLDLPGKLKESPPIGGLYVVNILAGLVAAGMLIHSTSRKGWVLAGLAGAATLGGYSFSRTIGLPTANGDIGNWLEPLGLASLFVEGALIALSSYALALPLRRSEPHPAGEGERVHALQIS